MKKSGFAAVVAIACTGLLLLAPAAFGATLAGNECTGTTPAEGLTVFGIANPAGTLPATIPSGGVITEWSIKFPKISGEPKEASAQGILKVLRPSGPSGGTIIGESAPANLKFSSAAEEVTTSATRIPVQAGDLLGDTIVYTFEGNSNTSALACTMQDPSSRVVAVKGSPTQGSQVSYIDFSGEEKGTFEAKELAVPVVVKVEADADGDGYGDETQDKCPTDADTQGACPVVIQVPVPVPQPATQTQTTTSPAPPLTLGAVSVPGAGAVDVYVTANAATTATVAGSVKLEKKKTTALAGVSQTVGAGALTKFVVALPAKVKARLKQLSTKQKLTLALSVSAPGASNTVPLSVKLPGQKKSVPAKH